MHVHCTACGNRAAPAYTAGMSTNAELVRLFTEMADALELTGAVVFRVNAYRNAARAIENLAVDVATLADDKAKLTAIDGIGDGTARRIIEYCQTGRIKEHEEIVSKVPPGLREVMHVPGIGPKTAKAMWEKIGVVDIASLKAKIESGELAKMPRMGEKTIQNIVASLQFMEKATQRTRLGEALPLAESLVEYLSQVEGVKKIEYAGSLRRGMETIGDIDLLAVATNPASLTDAFISMPMVEQVLGKGETKSSVRIARGMQVDLRIVPEASFGAALLYFTGSKQHNVELRERAQKKKLRLNEYGLFPDDGDSTPPQERGVKPKASKTEESIYKALGLPWIPPELSENRGEFDTTPPRLITMDDIQAELHAHTVASDGHLTIEELAQEAKERGFHTIAVTDHSRSSVQANGLSPERLHQHIDAVREAASRIKGITVLAGSEVDIHADGSLDYDDDLLAELDIVIASPHASLRQDPKLATQRLLRAIRHPLVHVIGHPTGRLINRREGLHPDIHALIEAAVEHNTALEINANHMRLDLRDVHVKAAMDAGALLAINTDAHTIDDFDELRYGVLTARRGWVTPDRCINAWSKAKLHKWLKSKR